MRTYDVVVIGAGAVGENVADRAGRSGLSVVIVEAELVGGECSYWACMPSKALLRPGQVLATARGVDGAGQAVRGGVDVEAALARRDAFAAHWDDGGQVRWLDGAGIGLIRGAGRLAGERRVVVRTDDGEVTLEARLAVVVATGSEPVIPDVPGLAEAAPWTSREATSAAEVPESLVVLGGGVVGVEMATAYADLGARVALVHRGGRLLERAEPFAGEALAAALREIGVDLRLGVAVSSAAREDGAVVVELEDGGVIRAAEVLVATGRRPRTGDLGVDTVGLEPGAALAVDDHLRVRGVSGQWLYAVGDVTGRVGTTHQGKYQARIAGDLIAAVGRGEAPADRPWSRHRADADHAAQPQVVFTRPEVAWVGHTAATAREAGLAVRTVDVALASAAGTGLHSDGADGTARLVVDQDDRVVGATFVGPEVAELLHAATLAVVGGLTLDRLWHAVPAYPTMSEVWLRLLEAAESDG